MVKPVVISPPLFCNKCGWANGTQPSIDALQQELHAVILERNKQAFIKHERGHRIGELVGELEEAKTEIERLEAVIAALQTNAS